MSLGKMEKRKDVASCSSPAVYSYSPWVWLEPKNNIFPLKIVKCVTVSRYQECFYGINLSTLRSAAVEEYFRQPIVVGLFVWGLFLTFSPLLFLPYSLHKILCVP